MGLDSLQLLPPSDFLKKLKLRTDLDQACRIKAERDASMKPGGSDFSELTAKVKDDFATKARNYFTFLLRRIREHVSLTADIVRGLASFDTSVLFDLPTEQASRCFIELYNSFRLRNWVPEDGLSLYRDEYMTFVDHLRVSYSVSQKGEKLIPDVVSFLTSHPALRDRPHLLYIFELSCLCLTEASETPAVVRFADVDTSSVKCFLSDVIQPVQFYLRNTPGCVVQCTNDDSLREFQQLRETLSMDSFSIGYDAWKSVDFFGSTAFYKTLLNTYNNLGTVKLAPKRTSASTSSVADQTVVRYPRKTKRVGFTVAGSKGPSRVSSDDSCASGSKSLGSFKIPKKSVGITSGDSSESPKKSGAK